MEASRPTPFYPRYAVPQLVNHAAPRWVAIVQYVSTLPITDPGVMAFALTLRRLGHRSGHRHDGRFCAVCARDILANFPGNEQELVAMYYTHLSEIKSAIQRMRQQQARQQAA